MELAYKVTASMLNGFQRFLDAEQTAEEIWNIDRNTGEYKTPPEEMAMQAECDLINSINRVDGAPIEVADRGTCLNEIVDCMIEGRKPCDGITVEKVKDGDHCVALRASLNGFVFDFDIGLCRGLRDYFNGAMCQPYTEAVMQTGFGPVLLYGYMDYWVGSTIYDLKTTMRYDFGKYANGWQKVVYPWCAIESKAAQSVQRFEYTAVQLRQCGGSYHGTMYPETYDYHHESATIALRDMVCRFIEWLNFRRELITDRKVFGGVNQPDYTATAITTDDL